MALELEKIFKDNIYQFIPHIGNLYFYNETDIFSKNPKDIRNNILNQSFKDIHQFEKFLKQKARRPNYDLYACFQPFNEALKALFPFLKKLKSEVNKGDIILNLWDRSGWMTTLLSGMFPDQHIITTWEGNKDILAYQGYHYWMKDQKNVTILFCDLNKPLPLKNNSIAFSVGLDVFHRFDQLAIMDEMLRLVKNEGAILFPHVHLSNSDPVPFFERGCQQNHGKDYQSAFDKLNITQNWDGYIFSEPKLFESNDIHINELIPLTSEPNTLDYNALIAILPKSWRGSKLSPFSMNDLSDIHNSRIIVNSLLNISLHQQKVFIDKNRFDGAMASFLKRHPVYVRRIKKLDNYSLTETATKIIFLAKNGLTINEISTSINICENNIINELKILEKLGLLQVLPISESGFRLQHYIMTQEFIIPKTEQTVKHLWDNAIKAFPDNTALISLQDDSEYTYADCSDIVETVINALLESGLNKGDKIIICNSLHIEAILLFWACMQIGVIVVPIAEHLSDDMYTSICTMTEAIMVFTNESHYSKHTHIFQNLETILFDYEEENPNYKYFANWINKENTKLHVIEPITYLDEGVILFTSGSTGEPKGVQLSQGNLYRSGRLITETFHWTKDDRFFAIGGLDGMSGLRNSSVSCLHIGASVVVPKEESVKNLFAITDSIESSQATILGSNPTLLRQVVKYKDKIRSQLDSLKILICTGNKLSNALRNDINKHYGLPIYNYYGLSETTGICTSQIPHSNLNNDSIGVPIDCIAQIVDENDVVQPPNHQGELRIFSNNLMQAYYKNVTQTEKVKKNGWFYTQDIAQYDQDGNILLLGRKRRIVKTATEELVYLDAIQQFLSEIDTIEDVYVCEFIKDDTEKIAAFITVKNKLIDNSPETKIKINKLLIEKFGLKRTPNQLEILETMPYSISGKLLKNQLLHDYI